MNCSSIVITVADEMTNSLISKIKESGICEYHLHKENQIIATIEVDAIEKEIAIIKDIQGWQGVISAEMVYSYCEDQINSLRDNVEILDSVPPVLADETLRAEQITYHGDLKRKI